MARHKDLSEANLHQCKGVLNASTGMLLHAASGVNSWEFPEFILSGYIDDVSTAGSYFLVAPYSGTITKIYTALQGAIGTADAGLSFEIGGAAVTDGGITITNSGSAAGDIDSSTPTANNTFTLGQAIELITDGASSNTVKVHVVLVCKRTS